MITRCAHCMDFMDTDTEPEVNGGGEPICNPCYDLTLVSVEGITVGEKKDYSDALYALAWIIGTTLIITGGAVIWVVRL